MYKGLIENLAFTYGFVCKARGKVPQEDLCALAQGTHTLVKHAPAVLGGEDEAVEDKKDYAEAVKMEGHIEEMVIFLQSLEIV